jgi:high-affinity nickel permease
MGERLGPSDAFWDTIGRLNDNADSLGFVIIGVFVSIWIGAIAFYRNRRRDEIDAAAD